MKDNSDIHNSNNYNIFVPSKETKTCIRINQMQEFCKKLNIFSVQVVFEKKTSTFASQF
jgi:hypothetical protein